MPTRAAGLLCLLVSCAAHAVWVQQFTPRERVDQQTGATATLNPDMAALGRPDAPPPFSVDCGNASGSARSVDTRRGAWLLERPLQPGERCLFAVRTSFRAVNGEAIQGQNRYRCYVPEPWPRANYPAPGSGIEEHQALIITPAGAVKPASVQQNAWCEADGVGHRIPVRVLAAKERSAALAAIRRGGKDEAGPSLAEAANFPLRFSIAALPLREKEKGEVSRGDLRRVTLTVYAPRGHARTQRVRRDAERESGGGELNARAARPEESAPATRRHNTYPQGNLQ